MAGIKKSTPSPINQIWRISERGRKKIFKTPEELWKGACDYFEWRSANKEYETVPMKVKVSRDVEEIRMIQVPKLMPFTMQGMCIYLGVNTRYINDMEEYLKEREDEESKEYSEIITRIRDIMFDQKFSGAAAGFFNSNIISVELGMAKKIETKINMEQPLFGDEESQ